MAKTEETIKDESRYTPKELAEVSHNFDVMPECVLAALKGVETITMAEAKTKIANFMKKEVKN